MKTYKILVAEDDPALLYSMKLRLSSEGYEVSCASDGGQAVKLAGEQRPDLLILDIHMPACDGFSVHDRIKKLPHLGPTPIIYVTGDRGKDLVARARDAGVRWLLRKPFDSGELLQIVRQTLEPEQVKLPAAAAPSSS